MVTIETRSKGEQTRSAILDEAAAVATIVGLDGLTIGTLAQATSMSKSGLYAHFGSKLDLQLATIEAARETFVTEVLRPALAAPQGIRRLRAACEAFLSHVERRVFPGGCFFSAAAADVGTRPGPARDAIAAQQREWLALLERLADEAIDLGELSADADPEQLAFELKALLVAANTSFILLDDAAAFGRARRAISERLRSLALPPRETEAHTAEMPEPSTLGRAFATALAEKDFPKITSLLHPQIDFKALTPNQSWEASDPASVVSGVLMQWFEEDDEIEGLLSLETDVVADRERVGYRFGVRNPDGRFIVEQQVYLSGRDGRIDWMRSVCSGFRPVAEPSANEEAVRAWDTVLYERWKTNRKVFVGALDEITDELFDRSGPAVGGRCIDIGCGFGETTQRLAELVGADGFVLGVDSSSRFIDDARREAAQARVENIDFQVADAQTASWEPIYDYAFSRMGTQFFAAPVPAMRAVRGALKPGGTLVNVCWRRKGDSQIWADTEMVVQRFLSRPDEYEADTCGPGPFSMGNPETCRGILEAAGFEAVDLERRDFPYYMGKDIEEAVDALLAIGPGAELIRLNGADGERRRPEIAQALAEHYRAWQQPDGSVVGRASVWIVTATNPG